MDLHKYAQLLDTAARSLLRRKMRSLLSILGVVCGVTAVVVMIAIGEGAKREAVGQIERLGTRNIYIKTVDLTAAQSARARENRAQGLSGADLDRLVKGCALIAGVAGLRVVKASVLNLPKEIAPQVAACSAPYLKLLNLPVASGRFIVEQDIDRKNLVCVLGRDVAARMGDRGALGQLIRIENQLFTVVGILGAIEHHSSGRSAAVSIRNHNEMVFLPLTSANELPTAGTREKARLDGSRHLSEIVIQIAHTKDVPMAAEIIRRIMHVAHGDDYSGFQIIVPLELLKQSARANRIFSLVLGAIAGISLLVGGIGIMNIMLATVSERTREIGIRRAVGASRRHIVAQFLSEAILLTAVGGGVGLLCGLAAVWGFAAVSGWHVAVPFWGIALPLLMSVLVGLFFGIYPARQASLVDPIVALRQ
jgi:putative ABC transport system permease protein